MTSRDGAQNATARRLTKRRGGNHRHRIGKIRGRAAPSASADGEDQTGGPPQNEVRGPQLGNDAEWAIVRQTRWVIGLTFVSAMAATAATFFAGVQAYDKSPSIQADASKSLAATAKVQAHAAMIQAEVTRDLVAASTNSMRLQERNFIAEQRPRLDESNGLEGLSAGPILFNGELGWNIVLKNYGRSSALKITDEAYLSVRNAPFKKVRTGHGRDTPPTQGYFFTVWFHGLLSSDEATKVRNGQGPPVAVKILTTYYDERGRRYVDGICQKTGDGAALQNCDFRAPRP